MGELKFPVWAGKHVGDYAVTGGKAATYHASTQCGVVARAQRVHIVPVFDHEGTLRRPYMRDQDTGDEVGKPMIDEGRKVVACEHCFDDPAIIHIDVPEETAIPCEGKSDEWMRMEGTKAEKDPDLFRPQQVDCFRCPIRVECFGKAMREEPRYGIWGGTTPAQRKAWGDRADEIVIRRLRNGQEVKPYADPGGKPKAYTPSLEGVG